MRRTGSGHAALAALALLLVAMPAWASIEFYQTADRTEVGTEDVFQLTVVVVEPPEGAQVQFPAPEDFASLSHQPRPTGSGACISADLLAMGGAKAVRQKDFNGPSDHLVPRIAEHVFRRAIER